MWRVNLEKDSAGVEELVVVATELATGSEGPKEDMARAVHG
jgi:hypothetical protein